MMQGHFSQEAVRELHKYLEVKRKKSEQISG